MFYGAKPGIFRNARDLRGRETTAEKILWEKLYKNRLLGFRFKRQHPELHYIVDFYCHKAKLVIELDGDSHANQVEYDKERTLVMEGLGLKVIRFKNEEVFHDMDSVLKIIEAEVRHRSPLNPKGHHRARDNHQDY